MTFVNNRQLKQCEVDAFIARVGPTSGMNFSFANSMEPCP
jgi:hypothetical protein